jgi:hypothetical protein
VNEVRSAVLQVAALVNGRAWALRRISSTITLHIVMALRHDLARSGSSCSVTSRTSAA